MTKFIFTEEALDAMTREQQHQLTTLAGDHCQEVRVQKGGLDLPDGYLAVAIGYRPDHTIYGGMSREGDLST